MTDVRCFDPDADYTVFERRLPHWTQANTACFVTWRTADSMPSQVVKRWMTDRNAILQRILSEHDGLSQNDHILRSHAADAFSRQSEWKRLLKPLPHRTRARVLWALAERWDRYLDECHGECVLKQPELSQIVADCLLRHDGDRYEMLDFVVTPNHVHLIAAFPDEMTLPKQCPAWKRFTAVHINRRLSRRGTFWQEDSFDHLIRSEEHFRHYRRYIKANPGKCRLRPDEYRWYSKDL